MVYVVNANGEAGRHNLAFMLMLYGKDPAATRVVDRVLGYHDMIPHDIAELSAEVKRKTKLPSDYIRPRKQPQIVPAWIERSEDWRPALG